MEFGTRFTISFSGYGEAGDIPIVGDWDGTGIQRIGVFRQSQWWLDINNDRQWDPIHDIMFYYGQPGDTPVIGDWNNTGRQRIGVFRPGVNNAEWWVDLNGDYVWDPQHDEAFFYGAPGDIPVVGDWTHTGVTRVGVVRSLSIGVPEPILQWWLDINNDHIWDSRDVAPFFGISGDIPIVAQ